jgi:hypothetical protein
MKQLNTLPIEQFLEKSRIASKSNQKNLIIDIKEAQALSDCLAVVMTRLVSDLDAQLQAVQNQASVISINVDGGGFK